MASKNPSENLSSFSVDDGTASDLQLQSVILAGFFQYLHSERARQHLAEIVTQPCLDVNRIRKRYDAIVALSEDPNLQAIILEIGQFEGEPFISPTFPTDPLSCHAGSTLCNSKMEVSEWIVP